MLCEWQVGSSWVAVLVGGGGGSLAAGPAHLKIRLGLGFFKDSLTGGKDKDEQPPYDFRAQSLPRTRFEVASLMWHLWSFLVGGFLSHGGQEWCEAS